MNAGMQTRFRLVKVLGQVLRGLESHGAREYSGALTNKCYWTYRLAPFFLLFFLRVVVASFGSNYIV